MGEHSTMVSTLASEPSCPGFDSWHSCNFFREKIVDVATVKQWSGLGQWLENVDQTHSVLLSGKLVLKKSLFMKNFDLGV